MIEKLRFDNQEQLAALRPFAEAWDKIQPQTIDVDGLWVENAMASIVYHKRELEAAEEVSAGKGKAKP